MSLQKKRQLIGLLTILGLLMILLAASLPALQMKMGLNLYAEQTAEIIDPEAESQATDYSNWETFIRVFSTIVNILLVIYIVTSLFSKAGRKQLLRSLAVFALLVLVIIFFSNMFSPFELTEEMYPSQIDEGEVKEIEKDPGVPVEFNPNPQPWLLTIVIIFGAVLLAGIAFFSISKFTRRTSLNTSHIDQIARKAQAALEEIEAAEISLDDIIIRCYAEMSLALQTEKGIQRAKEMTTFEFEQELIKSGLPARPVQQLTRLFEQVRYGHQQSGEKEKQLAVDSLGEIVDFCKVAE